MLQRHRRRKTTRQCITQQTEQLRDATASSQQQHCVLPLRPGEIAKCLTQLDHLTHLQMIEQHIGQAPARLAFDRKPDAPGGSHRRQAVTAPVTHAILLQIQLDMLPGSPVPCIAIAAQLNCQHVVGHPAARLDPGEYAVEAQRRV